MKKTISIFQYLLPISIGVFFIVYFLNKFDEEQKSQMISSFANAKYIWILLSIIIGLASHFIRAIRWKLTLKPLGYTPKTYNVFFAVMTCYIANLAFPRLGDVVRCTTLAKYERYSFNKVLGTVIAERAVDLFFLGIALVFVLVFQGHELNLFFQKTNIQFFSSRGMLKIILLIGSVLFFGIITTRLMKKSSNSLILKLTSFLRKIINGVKTIWQMEHKFMYIFYTIIIWVLYIMLFYVCIFALPETTQIGFVGSITCFLFGAIAISFTNGGLGAYPALIAQAALLYEISEAIGYTLGWIVWSGQTIMILIFGALSLLLFPILNKKNV